MSIISSKLVNTKQKKENMNQTQKRFIVLNRHGLHLETAAATNELQPITLNTSSKYGKERWSQESMEARKTPSFPELNCGRRTECSHRVRVFKEKKN